MYTVARILGAFFFSLRILGLSAVQNTPQVALVGSDFGDKFPDKFLVSALSNITDVIWQITGNGSTDITAPEALSWKSGWDFKYWLKSSDGTEATIVTSTDWSDVKKTVIAFCSSNDVKDWWTNLDAVKETNRFVNAPFNVEIHNGFQGSLFEYHAIDVLTDTLVSDIQWNNVKTLVDEKVMALIGDTNELYVTGHSLG